MLIRLETLLKQRVVNNVLIDLDIPEISWKGKTFDQILTTVRKNENSTIITPGNMHLAPPLKIYRKETNSNIKTKSSKLGITINSFEIPNDSFCNPGPFG